MKAVFVERIEPEYLLAPVFTYSSTVVHDVMGVV
jgi:hypothetical protein